MVAQVCAKESDRALPPSERAFEIYRMIEVDGVSTRTVAQLVGLSQTRVIQLRDSVEAWVARQRSATAGLTKQQRLQAAEYKAGLRLDHLYSLALEAFRRSQGPDMVSEQTAGGNSVVTTRITQGNTRYLQMAMRIAAQQSRIPTVTLIGEEPGDASDANTVDGEVVSTECAAATTAASDAAPSEEDCSPAAAQQSSNANATGQPSDVNAAATEDSDKDGDAAADASDDFAADFLPVHAVLQTADEVSLADRPLTRKERKRRARLLAQKRQAVRS